MRESVGAGIIGLVAGFVACMVLYSSLTPNPYGVMLVAVMVTGGLLGGLVNYLLARADAAAKASLLTSLFAGVAAALLVPLFLNMLSSDLLNESKSGPVSTLVFLGFCLIAAISSRAFITSISQRLLRQVEEARDEAREANQEVQRISPKVEGLAASRTEPPPPPPAQPRAEARAAVAENAARLSDEEKTAAVLRALNDERYDFRFLSGLVADTRLPAHEVEDILARLKNEGLVGRTSDKTGVLFYLTTKGHEAVQNL